MASVTADGSKVLPASSPGDEHVLGTNPKLHVFPLSRASRHRRDL